MPEAARRMHHRVAYSFFTQHIDDLRKMAQGEGLGELGQSFQVDVATFGLMPVCERLIEAKHKDIKRAAGPRVGAVKVSLAVRAQQWVHLLEKQPENLHLMLACFQRARHVRALPSLLRIESHPSIETLKDIPPEQQQTSAWVTAISRILYRTDIASQTQAGLDAEAVGREHVQAATRRKRALEKRPAAACQIEQRHSRCPGFGASHSVSS